MSMTGIIAAIDIIDAAMRVAIRANEALMKAQTEGRDVSMEEIDSLRSETADRRKEWDDTP